MEKIIQNMLSELKNLYMRKLIKDETYAKYGEFLKKLKNRTRIDNAIIIGGNVYELIDDREGDECERCALAVDCDSYRSPICVTVFSDAEGKRFERKKDIEEGEGE